MSSELMEKIEKLKKVREKAEKAYADGIDGHYLSFQEEEDLKNLVNDISNIEDNYKKLCAADKVLCSLNSILNGYTPIDKKNPYYCNLMKELKIMYRLMDNYEGFRNDELYSLHVNHNEKEKRKIITDYKNDLEKSIRIISNQLLDNANNIDISIINNRCLLRNSRRMTTVTISSFKSTYWRIIIII